FAEAETLLLNFPKDTLETDSDVPTPKSILLAELYWQSKQTAKARAQYEAARPIVERGVHDNPNNATWHSLLGEVYAGLGRKGDSIRDMKLAGRSLSECRG